MREKYIDEKVPPLFVFGSRPGNRRDISNGIEDVFTALPADIAYELQKLNYEYRKSLYELLKDC